MSPSQTQNKAVTVGGAIFVKLKALGVDHVFVNSGTDFPPVIEGLAQASAGDQHLPEPVIVPHEHAAVGMAHGHYLASGKAQAVMLHTNVGLSNGVTGLINAAIDQIPMLVMSGRTPTTEQGRFGSRTVPIGWGQEMRDQHGLIREACKWDYEIRFAEQIAECLERAWAIAHSTPCGPVYLSLPREVLCEPVDSHDLASHSRMQPALAGVRPSDINRAAAALVKADKPLIVAQRTGNHPDGFATLKKIAEDYAIPVCQYWATQLALDTAHDLNVGSNPAGWIEQADCVLVVDSLAPWSPDCHHLTSDATVIQLGPDPLFSRAPVRMFKADICLSCETHEGLVALESAMSAWRDASRQPAIEQRRSRVAKHNAAHRAAAMPSTDNAPLTKAAVGQLLSEALHKNTDTGRFTVFSELGVPLDSMRLSNFDSWYQEPHAGGLGWSVPAAMGVKLADPSRLCVATLGDGSYMFANPTACHQVMQSCELALLIVIVNNAQWGAVKKSVEGLYPDGFAAKANRMPLTSLAPSPDFSQTASACGAWARRIDSCELLAQALEQALTVIKNEQRTAVLDVQICD